MLNCPHPHRRGGHPEGEGDFSREGCGGLEAFVHNFDDLEITTGSQLRSLWYDANHDRSFHLPVGKDLSRQRRRSWSWIISNLEQEVRRCQGLLEEVDSELNDMIRVTRRGYTFHEAGVPPPPPQNQSLVYILKEYLQKREETVIQWFREERASRGNHDRVEDGGKESDGGGWESGGGQEEWYSCEEDLTENVTSYSIKSMELTCMPPAAVGKDQDLSKQRRSWSSWRSASLLPSAPPMTPVRRGWLLLPNAAN